MGLSPTNFFNMTVLVRTEFAAALNQLASEKGVEVEVILSAIKQAVLAAYRKDLSLQGETIPDDFDELIVDVNPASGEISILKDKTNITPPGFARIAAQTAKQVIAQKLAEAEKDAIHEEYEKKIGMVVSGMIQRQEGNTFFVDLGRAEGVLPPPEQSRGEYYYQNQRLKFYVKEIRMGKRGPEVVVSRSDPGLVKGLFAMEVPEVQLGSVVIKEIAREAGERTKLAASSTKEGVDPVGALVGQKGVRVQAVTNELGEEKVDIISYSEDPARFIASALSPAKEVQVTLVKEGKEGLAKVKVPARQLSLAIGKGGQNVRLAAKLTGYKIDIEGMEEPPAALAMEGEEVKEVKEVKEEGTKKEEKQVDQTQSDQKVTEAAEGEPSDQQKA